MAPSGSRVEVAVARGLVVAVALEPDACEKDGVCATGLHAEMKPLAIRKLSRSTQRDPGMHKRVFIKNLQLPEDLIHGI